MVVVPPKAVSMIEKLEFKGRFQSLLYDPADGSSRFFAGVNVDGMSMLPYARSHVELQITIAKNTAMVP
jgi:hypothetical protein